MKIAVIGSGIAGLSAAYYLSKQHEVHVFEKAERLGGHTATKDVLVDGKHFAIDTGFIVFNDWTYPNFIRLLAELAVPWQNTRMSFSVSCKQIGLEYAGSNLNSLFCQRKNLFSPYFLKIVRDILRFNKEAPRDLEEASIPQDKTLGDYLRERKYSEGFVQHYLVPMGAAIWSASYEDMLNFPLHFFVRFFKNHGLLSVKNRPQWKTVKGGSRQYIQPLTRSFKNNVHLNSRITRVTRSDVRVYIEFEGKTKDAFDHVIFACHSDEALALLGDASAAEHQILSAIPYKSNDVILHTDSRMLPKNKLARSSWNYTLVDKDAEKPTLTYDMNTLQNISSKRDFLVTLNQSEGIDAEKILGVYSYSHPQFTLAGIAAQQRWAEINGPKNTWYCGAYWRNGFHEDGIHSALRVVNGLQGESENTRVLEGKARESDLAKGEAHVG